MADLATAVHAIPAPSRRVERGLDRPSSRGSVWIFALAVITGLSYIGIHVARDMDNVTVTSIWPYLLLGLALLIALGFEFVNGFHDTANAVATVIYTNSLTAEYRRGLVRAVQPGWRASLVRYGGLRSHHSAAG